MMFSDRVFRVFLDLILLLVCKPRLCRDVTCNEGDAGYAHMGMGSATGKDKATVAADMAISSPLETSIDGAKGLINITASTRSLERYRDAASTMIKDKAQMMQTSFGVLLLTTMEDAISVTVIATGFNADGQIKANLTGRSFISVILLWLRNISKSNNKG